MFQIFDLINLLLKFFHLYLNLEHHLMKSNSKIIFSIENSNLISTCNSFAIRRTAGVAKRFDDEDLSTVPLLTGVSVTTGAAKKTKTNLNLFQNTMTNLSLRLVVQFHVQVLYQLMDLQLLLFH
jgi:hypothetical protein